MQRFTVVSLKCAAVVIVAAIVSLASERAHADQPLLTVSGGGTAEFLDEDLNPTGFTSQFSVGAAIDVDGTVSGHFMCMIVHVVTISGQVEEVDVNEDGSVTLYGIAHGVDHLFPEKPFFDCPFSVTVYEGGPDVGGFIYSDCVVTDDTEVVCKGHIMINEH